MANQEWKISGISSKSAKADAREATPIFDESEGLPPKGPYRARIKRMQAGETGPSSQTPGTPKVQMVSEINEPAGTTKAKYNGFGAWAHLQVTDANADSISQWLDVITDGKPASTKQKVRDAFWSGNVMLGDNKMIARIGTFSVPAEVDCGMNLTARPANPAKGYGESRQIGDFFPISQAPKARMAEDEEPDDEPDEDEDTDEEEGDEAADERQEELEAMSLAQLRSAAKKLKLDTTGLKKAGLAEAMMDEEFPPEEEEDDDEDDEEDEPEEEEDDESEEDDEEEDEEDPDSELREELAGLSKVKLKNRAKSNGAKVAALRDLDEDGLIDLIVEQESDEDADDEEDEDEEEEAPEPPKRGRRAAATAKAAPARKGRRSKGDEPPF